MVTMTTAAHIFRRFMAISSAHETLPTAACLPAAKELLSAAQSRPAGPDCGAAQLIESSRCEPRSPRFRYLFAAAQLTPSPLGQPLGTGLHA